MMMKKNEKLEVRDVAVDAIESTELVEAPEKKQPKKIWLLLAALGPGIVTAMAGNDAGGISTYSTVGAKFGFATLWVIPIMCVLLIVVEMTAARMGAVTGKGFAALIRERFGIRLTALAMLALLIGNVATTFSEFAGIASGMEMFGVSKYLAVPVAAVAVWLLVVGGSYKRVEKVFLILSLVACVAFVCALLSRRVDPHPHAVRAHARNSLSRLWAAVRSRLPRPAFPLAGLLLCCLLAAGCTLGPDYKRPDLDLPAASVAADEPGVLFTRERWWEVFHDGALNRLEEAALAHNSNLAQAMARVEEASAAAGVAFADRLPAVGLRSQDGKRLMTEGEELTHHYASRTQEAYKAVGFLSFELDLWGKYRRLDEAARAELLSTEAARDTIRLAVASETALVYFQLRTLQEQERIAADMLKSYERTCKVYETRYRLGQSPETTLRRFAAERDKTQAQLYDLEERRIRCEGALAVLAGFSPAGIVDGAGRAFQEGRTLGELAPPPDVPSGIPSDLLQRRPDVRSAEGRLMVANARIGAARAAFFPSSR